MLIGLFASSLLLASGCSRSDRPTLGKVRGKVTMDGKPLARALVGFQPKGKGRESIGPTDAEGNYELKYNLELAGAGVGENRVRISTQHSMDPRSETVPRKYSDPQNSTLHYDVKPGDNNDVNFDLQSR